MRPTEFEDIIGQDRIKDILSKAASTAKRRNLPMRHVLLGGPPGLGKTTLAQAIAATMGSDLRSVLAPAIEKPADLLQVVLSLGDKDVLFIDEIHRLSSRTEESLFTALEDQALDVMVEGSYLPTRIMLREFTLVGATTHIGGLSPPFRDRFPLSFTLEPYADEEIAEIIENAVRQGGASGISPRICPMIAARSRGVPRIGLNLLALVLDVAPAHAVTSDQAQQAMSEYGVDERGLTGDDRRYLRALGPSGPLGLDALSQKLDIPVSTMTTVIEPFLVRQGLIVRIPTGRIATPDGAALIGQMGETKC